MTLTPHQQACDLWCIDHEGEPPFCAPSEFSLLQIEESRARIAAQRKAAGLYAETDRLEAKRQAEERDWISLGERIHRAEDRQLVAEELLYQQTQSSYVDQSVAWLCGVLTGAAVVYAAMVAP